MRAFFIVLAVVAPLVVSQNCPTEGVQYYADSQFCDKYSQCREGVPSEQQCPDGLLFNDLVTNGRYPCDYPAEVDCGSRTKKQPAQPTQFCANQWGYFSSGSKSECSYFYNCIDGHGFRYECPEGLAFSSATYRCEYADDSPDCDAEAFLGFSCPDVEDVVQVAAVGFSLFRSPRNCRQFFLCAGRSPRLQVCDLGRVFNENTRSCDEPENVRGCEDYYPADELKAIRARRAKEEEVREARRLAFEARREELAKKREG